jgi:hypothetical protein
LAHAATSTRSNHDPLTFCADDNITATGYDKGDCDILVHEESQYSLVHIDRTTNIDSQRQHAGTPADGGPNESRLFRSMDNTLHSNTREKDGSVADLQQQSEFIPDTLQPLMGKANIRTSEELLMYGSGGWLSISGEDECSNHLPGQSTQQTNHRAAIEAIPCAFNLLLKGKLGKQGKLILIKQTNLSNTDKTNYRHAKHLIVLLIMMLSTIMRFARRATFP